MLFVVLLVIVVCRYLCFVVLRVFDVICMTCDFVVRSSLLVVVVVVSCPLALVVVCCHVCFSFGYVACCPFALDILWLRVARGGGCLFIAWCCYCCL